MVCLLSFAETLVQTDAVKRHLLLGNGFSISLFPDCFRYDSLLEAADFSHIPEVHQAFETLETSDFEIVIHGLLRAGMLLPLYSADNQTASRINEDAAKLKELLVQAIAGKHPERPGSVTEEQYLACRRFLACFAGDSRNFKADGGKDLRGHIYSVNYDLLLYWVLLHEAATPSAEGISSDDGFRAPDEDPEAMYVTWDGEGSHSQTVFYLHGALHLFEHGPELQKRCWERSGGVPLIEQIRAALDEGRFPLFVAEGDTKAKFERIRHSGYLHKSLRSFRAAACDVKGTSLFVFGHSLAENDAHIFKQIEKGRCSQMYVGIYGDAASSANRTTIERARKIGTSRHEKNPLEVYFFDAQLVNVWGSTTS
jgi:hypothetical protein